MNNDIPTRLETRARLRETARDTDCAGHFHEFEEHEHDWYMGRVYLWLAASLVACIVALSLYAVGIL